MLPLITLSGLSPSLPVIRSTPSAMFAATFSLTIRSASRAAFGPPSARLPKRAAITMLDSAASAHASMEMSNQLGFFVFVMMVQLLWAMMRSLQHNADRTLSQPFLPPMHEITSAPPKATKATAQRIYCVSLVALTACACAESAADSRALADNAAFRTLRSAAFTTSTVPPRMTRTVVTPLIA